MQQKSPASPYRLESVKICGITSLADRDMAANLGADFFGVLVDVGYSPRSLNLNQARRLLESPPIPGVVLLFDADQARVRAVVETLEPHAVQLLGHETPELVASLKSTLNCEVWKSLHVPARGRGEIDMEQMKTLVEEFEDSGVDAMLFTTVDTSGETARFGGTGMIGDWGVAARPDPGQRGVRTSGAPSERDRFVHGVGDMPRQEGPAEVGQAV